MRTSARHWGCLSAFRVSREPIPHFTNARTPLFWQRPSGGWQPILNALTRLSTSPTAISSGGRTCGPSSPTSSGWSWLRHDPSALRGPWPTRVRSGKKSSKRTGCRNSGSKKLRPGATRTASSLPITISSPTPARPAVSDSTTSSTPRRCFFGCFQIFGVSGSFRDLPSVLAEDWRSPAERAVRLLREIWLALCSSTRDQVVHLGEKHFEKRGRVCPVIADHQIDHRCFALQRAADDRWRKKISRIKGQQGDATRGYDHR